MGKLYKISSLLMAALFTVSAALQFNDQRWFSWIPLYALAAYVSLTTCLESLPLKGAREVSTIALYQAEFLLITVMLDDNFTGNAGLWSLDMREKLVREKLGCVLVILSTILQTSAIELFQKEPTQRMNLQVTPSIQNGMAILVGISYGLSFVFLKYNKQDINF